MADEPTPTPASPEAPAATDTKPQPDAAEQPEQQERPSPHAEKMERLRKELDETGDIQPTDEPAEPEQEEAAEPTAESPAPTDSEPSDEDPDARPEPEGEEQLPDGWYRDTDGRLRNERGDYAKLPEQEQPEPESSEAPAPEEQETEQGEQADHEPLVAKLPGRRPDDPEFEFEIDAELAAVLESKGYDPTQVAERMNQATNGYARRQEVQQDKELVQRERAELDHIHESMAADPASFLVEQVGDDVRRDVARNLLLSMDDESFDQLVDDVATWTRNPQARETEAIRAENERLRTARDREQSLRQRRQETATAQEIARNVNNLIPEEMDDDRAGRFYRYAISSLQTYLREDPNRTLEPPQVPDVLGRLGVLDDFGLSTNGSGRDSTASRPAADGAARKGSADASGSEPASGDVQDRMERRRQAAATAPAGAGSGAAEGFKKVPGETYKERRNRLARMIGVPEKEEIS